MSRPFFDRHVYSAALLAAAGLSLGLMGGCGGGGGGGGGGGSSAMPTPPKVSTDAPYPGTDGTLPGSGSGGGGGGGGGGDGGGDTPPPNPPPSGMVAISGIITYDSVPADPVSGLKWSNVTKKPCRGIVVLSTDSAGTTIHYTGVTNDLGRYTVYAPKNSAIKIVATSAYSADGTTVLARVNNAGQEGTGPLWAVSKDFTTTTSGGSLSINAASGYDSSSGTYTAARAASPFAILDVFYEVRTAVAAAKSTLQFPLININWKPNGGNGAFFSPGGNYIWIGDVEGQDTNDYDRAVTAHESGHAFMFNFSKDNSFGGGHALGSGGNDILDETTAFSEGMAYGVGMGILRESHYVDTGGPGGSRPFGFDIAADIVPSSAVFPGTSTKFDGDWSEPSCAQIHWKCSHSPIANGMGPMITMLTSNEWKNHKGFSAMMPFIKMMSTTSGVSAGALTSAASAENIGAGDLWNQSAAGRRRYTTVNSDGVIVTKDANDQTLKNDLTYVSRSGADNKYLVHSWLRLKATTPGTYNLKLVPGTASHGFIIRSLNARGQSVMAMTQAGTQVIPLTLTSTDLAFSVALYQGDVYVAAPFTAQFGTAAVVNATDPSQNVSPDAFRVQEAISTPLQKSDN